MKNKIDPRRYFPLGAEWLGEMKWIGGGFILSALYSLGYFFKLATEHSNLYLTQNGNRILREGAVMPDFTDILGGSLWGFFIIALLMAVLAAYHYSVHFTGGRSIYLMRRLPSRWELPKRCLTVPALAAAAALTAAFITMCIYLLIYMAITPEQCLTAMQWQKIWR